MRVVWGRRGSEQQRAAATAARDAAVHEFYRLDTAQRGARIAVAAYQRMRPGPEADGFATELAPLDAQADDAARGYLAALDGHALEDIETADGLEAAVHALGAAREQLTRCAAALEAFVQRRADVLAELDRQMEEGAARVAAAGRALQEAYAAVAALADRAGDVRSLLAAAQVAADRLEGGVAALGVVEALRLAEVALHLAEQTRLAAEGAPEREAALRRRVSSLHVRVQAVQHRASLVEGELSRLRRGHVASSWREVEAGLEGTSGLLTLVLERLRNAEGFLEAGERERAADLVRSVVQDLERLERVVDAVGERRRRLDELASDPEAAIGRVRFVVRDAQRLALAGRREPEVRWVSRLDSLVARLERAGADVAAGSPGPRPDWWAFGTELAAVERDAQEVVEDVRRTRAAQNGG